MGLDTMRSESRLRINQYQKKVEFREGINANLLSVDEVPDSTSQERLTLPEGWEEALMSFMKTPQHRPPTSSPPA